MKGETEWNRLNYKWLPESVHGLWFFDPSLKLSAALQRLITLELFAKIYYYHEAQWSQNISEITFESLHNLQSHQTFSDPKKKKKKSKSSHVHKTLNLIS